MPARLASSRAARVNAVLPAPAGPSTKISVPSPTAARLSPSRSVSSSRSRSSRAAHREGHRFKIHPTPSELFRVKTRGETLGGSSLVADARTRRPCHEVNTVSELNKQKVRLFVEAVLNEGRLELIDELVAADYMGQIPCPERRVDRTR